MSRRSVLSAAFSAVLVFFAFAIPAQATVNVSIVSLSPATIGDKSGTTSAALKWEIAPDSSETGTYRVEVDGDGTPESGRLVDDSEGHGDFSGTVTQTTPISASGDLKNGDGDYTLYVIATDTTGVSTNASITLTLDNYPTAPTGLGAGIGDGELFLSWNNGSARDLKRIDLYYGNSPGTTAADYTGTDASQGDSPIDVGTSEKITLKGLTNGTAYYFRLMTTDDAGDESPLSDEFSGTPQVVDGLAGLTDEKGGCFVATAAYGDYDAREVRVLRRLRDEVLQENAAGRAFIGFYYRVSPPLAAWIARHGVIRAAARAALAPVVAGSVAILSVPPGTRAWLLGLPLLFGAVVLTATLARRRRGRLVVVLALIAATGLLAVPPAEASAGPHFSADIHVSFLIPQIREFQKIYKSTFMMTYGFEFGYKLVRDLEIVGDASYGLASGRGLTPTGAHSGEKYMLHLVPASLSLLYRLKFYEDQPVVPYLGGGVTYAFFYEMRVSDPSKKTSGAKWGWQGFGGLQFLLDLIDRRASSSLEADYGIHNTYLFYEFRYQGLNGFKPKAKGLDLSSMVHTLGFLMEF